jgi:hypothetical protein
MTQPGLKEYLGSTLTKTHWWGIVSDIDTPALMTATMELVGEDAVVTMSVLKGDQGLPGQDADIVKMQYQDDFTSVGQIPVSTLTTEESDIGKAWWIGNIVYVWGGTSLQAKAMGTQGNPGPVPNVHPSVNLLDPDGSVASSVTVDNTDPYNPSWILNLKAPRGPMGENATIRGASDYLDTLPPEFEQVIAWNGTMYAPTSIGTIVPKVYSFPEGAFTSFTGASSRQNIGTFAIEPQPFPWTPIVLGHVRAIGVELTTDPLTLGAEVRIGDYATGTLVGRGFGNISTFANIIPHYSTPSSTTDAVTPSNGRAIIPENHTGTQGTFYCNLANDGALGAYNFNNKDAQITIIVVPTGPIPPPGS